MKGDALQCLYRVTQMTLVPKSLQKVWAGGGGIYIHTPALSLRGGNGVPGAASLGTPAARNIIFALFLKLCSWSSIVYQDQRVSLAQEFIDN